MRRVLIVGTGLIGASVGLALRAACFDGEIVGTGPRRETLMTAHDLGAISSCQWIEGADAAAEDSDVIVLCGPVLSILDWMQRLAPHLGEHQLVTDVGSTKLQIAELAVKLGYNQPGKARFLPGHPMAGKESGGAALAEAALFQNAMWLFTPVAGVKPSALEAEWRVWVAKFGERALREMTRLGASPYSMWRDIALSNTESIALTLHALEQRLAHVRENLRTPELKEEFRLANEFRKRRE